MAVVTGLMEAFFTPESGNYLVRLALDVGGKSLPVTISYWAIPGQSEIFLRVLAGPREIFATPESGLRGCQVLEGRSDAERVLLSLVMDALMHDVVNHPDLVGNNYTGNRLQSEVRLNLSDSDIQRLRTFCPLF